MPFQKLVFKPGINRDTTNYANEGGWYECDKVRFYSGFPQKIGGWLKATSETFVGTCRQMWNWVTSFTDNLLAVGTNSKAYIEVGGYFYDITPLRATFSSPITNNCISTTNLSSVVTVTIAGHGCLTGDYVTISNATSVGGIPVDEINKEHQITRVSDNVFTFPSTTAASSTTSGGGTNIVIACQIHPGFALPTEGYGWGTGPYGGASATTYTVTITIASPAVVTFSGYSPTNGSVVYLTTTGALPTGLSPSPAYYYVVNVVGSTCNLAATPGGTPINTSGTQSGTHTASVGITGWGLAGSTPVYLPQQDWFFDNFDNDLVMNIRKVVTGVGVPTGGPIYYWARGTTANISSALGSRAVLLSSVSGAGDVPESATQILVSQNDKHLLAFGCQPFGGSSGDFDPLLIRWASQNDPQYWTPGTQLAPSGLPSTSGFIRVSRGSQLVRAIPTRQEIAVFTDTHLYSLQYLATTDVFGLQEIADNISIMGPRAVSVANNFVFWMGLDKFYVYDGRVQTLPCTLKDHVFRNINRAQANAVVCGTNEGFNEVWWFYASGNSNWVDSYVVYNHLEQLWYYGSLGRTAWLDTASRDTPTAAYTDESQNPGLLYNHEIGIDADGAPMSSYIQSSDFDIGDGEQLMLSRRVIPDVNFSNSTVQEPQVSFAIRSRNWPGSNFQNDPSDTKNVVVASVGTYTDQVFIRARGRQMALKVASEDLGVQWQLGAVRLDARPDGKR